MSKRFFEAAMSDSKRSKGLREGRREGSTILGKYLEDAQVHTGLEKRGELSEDVSFLEEPNEINDLAERLAAVARANRRLRGVGLETVMVLPATGRKLETAGSKAGEDEDNGNGGIVEAIDVIGPSKAERIYTPMAALAHVAKMCIARTKASELFMKEKYNAYSPRDNLTWPRSTLRHLYGRCRDTLYKHAFVQFGMENLLRSKENGGQLSKNELAIIMAATNCGTPNFFFLLEEKYKNWGREGIAPVCEDAFASYWENLPYGDIESAIPEEAVLWMTKEKWYPKLRRIAKTMQAFRKTSFGRKSRTKELEQLQICDVEPLPLNCAWGDALAVLVKIRRSDKETLEQRVFRHRSGSQAARLLLHLYQEMEKRKEQKWRPGRFNKTLLGPQATLEEHMFATQGRAAIRALIVEWHAAYAFLPKLDDSASAKLIVGSIHEVGLLCKVKVELEIVSL